MLPRRRRQASGGTARAGPVFPTKGGGHRGGAAGTPWRLGRSCHPTQLASQLAAQQCTQMSQNSSERPFPPICVHFCVPTSVRNGATVYTNAPKRHRVAILTDLCTLPCRRPGGDAHVAGAVTQPPTHTNSRSLYYLSHITCIVVNMVLYG